MLSAEQVWWERVKRAADRRGLIGVPGLMGEWAHAMIVVLGAAPGRMELVGPFGQRRHQLIPAERCTDEYKQLETRRLNDQLGVALGVGPMP